MNTTNTSTSLPNKPVNQVNNEQGQVVVTALYKFTPFANFADYRQKIQKTMEAQGVKGTLLIAHEGINGTIAGSRKGIDHVLDFLRSIPAIGEFPFKESFVDDIPFYRTKVKLKKEIVTLGVEGIDPLQSVGRYIKPTDWNALISDPDVTLIDTRNDYEVQIGTFQNAVNPNTDTFREFPEYIKDNLDPEKNKKVAMFCTGGIRCEKSTAYLMSQGFEEVYHLEGGILKYLEDVPKEESMWEGECFVFDSRVAVNHDLEKGQYDQCYACRFPITEEDKKSPAYEHGLSCPHCIDSITEKQKQRFYEREHQLQLAKQRGETHIGGEVKEHIEVRRQEKLRVKAEAKKKMNKG